MSRSFALTMLGTLDPSLSVNMNMSNIYATAPANTKTKSTSLTRTHTTRRQRPLIHMPVNIINSESHLKDLDHHRRSTQ